MFESLLICANCGCLVDIQLLGEITHLNYNNAQELEINTVKKKKVTETTQNLFQGLNFLTCCLPHSTNLSISFLQVPPSLSAYQILRVELFFPENYSEIFLPASHLQPGPALATPGQYTNLLVYNLLFYNMLLDTNNHCQQFELYGDCNLYDCYITNNPQRTTIIGTTTSIAK